MGPAHGGANEAVIKMLEEIGDVSNIQKFIDKEKKKKKKLMGFGHKVYKNYDQRTCDEKVRMRFRRVKYAR